MIRFMGLGGYDEVGMNMHAVKANSEVVIMDMGLHLPNLLEQPETFDHIGQSVETMIDKGIIPNYHPLDNWLDKITAIIFSHAHLDHLAAAPYILPYVKAPILGTPFTIEVLKRLLREHQVTSPRKIVTVRPNSKVKITDELTIEFIHATHSTPQTAIIALHTQEGIIVYANDWKLDNYPIIGNKTNINRLKQLGEEGVRLLISDVVNVNLPKKTHSESVVQEMMRDVLFGVENDENAIFVTTFSSHLARLKTILNFAVDMGRIPIILGTSMKRYIKAGEKSSLVNFSSLAQIFAGFKQVKKALIKIEKKREDYLVITTGHQGEPRAVLTRIANGQSPFKFRKGDQVIYSSSIIPQPINQIQRVRQEQKIQKQGARIFRDIHVSGHGSREDHRDMLEYLAPDHFIPTHAPITTRSSAISLASEIGYNLGENAHLIQNGQRIVLD